MEKLARSGGQRGSRGLRSIEGVAQDGVTDRGEVDADLVGAAGFGVGLNEGGVVERLDDAIVCFGGANGSLGASPGEGNALAVAAGGASDRGCDHAFLRFRNAEDESEIALLYEMILEKIFESREGSFVSRNKKKTACVLVEAVNDAGAHGVANLLYFRISRDDPVCDRAAFSCDGRVDLDAGGLVYDDEVWVFFDDRERKIGFGKKRFFLPCLEFFRENGERFVGGEGEAWLYVAVFHEHAAHFDAMNDLRSAQLFSNGRLKVA